jgi:hypothetical protein
MTPIKFRRATTFTAVQQLSLELQCLIFVLSVRLNETATTPVFVYFGQLQ